MKWQVPEITISEVHFFFFPRSQSSNHREFRDCEKGEIFNAVGIYKRTTSPMRSVNDYDNVKSRVGK